MEVRSGVGSDPPGVRTPRRGYRGRHRAIRRTPLLVVVGLTLAIAIVVRSFFLEPFSIPSESMQPGLQPGDRVLVTKFGPLRHFQRGDVVVFDGTSTFGAIRQPDGNGLGALARRLTEFVAGRTGESDYVKRVVGVGGDRVRCCTSDGRLQVNGMPVAEPYLYPGDVASRQKFDVVVPAGRVWLMGDHRSRSADSRSHLAAPGGGTVAEGDVIGPVAVRIWPLNRIGGLDPAPALRSVNDPVPDPPKASRART
ncbi:MAG: signal peptidase I [Austwickia sp.]|jgi:signal peptidase I|nr:signal peptidase I [Austwickia sp.]